VVAFIIRRDKTQQAASAGLGAMIARTA